MSGEPQPTTAGGDRPLFLAIAGNIGVGKSTLTRHLADKWGLTLLPEPVKQNPFLKLYYDDPKRWGIQSQLFFLTQRVRLFKEAGALNHAKIVDRTLYEDAEIFARTALSRVEYQIYLQLYEYLLENLPVPDLVVYLRASTKTLSRRIQQKRSHDVYSRGDVRSRSLCPLPTFGNSTSATRHGQARFCAPR